MKTIKAIYVLDEISNDENYRPTVKFRDMTYTYDKSIGDYTNDFNSEYGIFSGWAINLMLNEEVEIIEEDKAIEKFELEEIDNKVKYKSDTGEYTVRVIDIDMMAKINEIIDVIKEIKENKEEK